MIVSDVSISRSPGSPHWVVNVVYWDAGKREHRVERILTDTLEKALSWVMNFVRS